MTLPQFLAILHARAKLICFTLLVTVLITLGVSVLLPKQYTANTAVIIDVKSPDPIAGVVLPGLISPGYMATQVDIINSNRVAQRVVKLLRLDENPAIKEQWRDATEGKGKIVVWLAELLQKKLDVKPSRESNVIDINYSGADPAFAAAVANAFAKAYIDVNLELKVEPARQSSLWFDEQTKALREKLEKAQLALSSFQQVSGIIGSDERLDYELNKLNDLSTQLTVVQGQVANSLSKRNSSEGSNSLEEVMQNPLINNLKSDIARLEAKLDESNVNLGKNHPQTKRTESELASLKSKLAIETRQISKSIGTSYQVSKQTESELKSAIEVQKKKVLQLNNQRDEIRVLKQDVESAEKAFEAVSQRAAETRLESLYIQTNVVQMNMAEAPIKPSKPKVFLNVLVSIFLGTLLGVAAALLFELTNRRVRTSQDLADVTEAPVLASIASITKNTTMMEKSAMRKIRNRFKNAPKSARWVPPSDLGGKTGSSSSSLPARTRG